jgi:hypothetical protein
VDLIVRSLPWPRTLKRCGRRSDPVAAAISSIHPVVAAVLTAVTPAFDSVDGHGGGADHRCRTDDGRTDHTAAGGACWT